ncbi:MAG: cytochrome b/b6 domain-containing protein [Gammaproteobacteria bacterium]|nr:cytochrome b/b6 domain-containing protein [Gammaproteobacteria bacterium]MCP5298715.1 cytochrome b/b6 domain-containing protein [Chromatiaceae bacterium]
MEVKEDRILVWDPFVRVFHWSLVTAFVVAWASGDEWASLHERAGYFIGTLVVLRVVWGLIGTRHARFTDFVVAPRRVGEYLNALRTGGGERYLGHNPAGAWMIVSLLVMLTLTIGSGLLMADGEQWEELHEALAWATLLLVLLHVAGVVVSGLLHHENLVRAMVTGRKVRRQLDV